MRPIARAILPVLLAALPAAVLAPSALATDEPADSGVEITSVGPAIESGGYPTIYWGYNGLAVVFGDSTPGDGHVYTATATPVAGGDPLTATFEAYEGWDGEPFWLTVGTYDDVPIDSEWTVTVSEHDGDTLVGTSAPVGYVLAAVGHPSWAELEHKKAGGKNTVRAGSKVRIAWTDSWEVGTKLTQVVYAVRKNGTFADRDVLFCEGSYCPTRKGVRWVKYGSDPLVGFKVPERLAGKTLRVVSYGNFIQGGVHVKAQWGWEWSLKIRTGGDRTAQRQVTRAATGSRGAASHR